MKYKATQQIQLLPPGTHHLDYGDMNAVEVVIDAAAASNGASVNGVPLPAGTHRFGCPDPYGTCSDIYTVYVPAVRCTVSAIVTRTIPVVK
jgi:hypothetical protein